MPDTAAHHTLDQQLSALDAALRNVLLTVGVLIELRSSSKRLEPLLAEQLYSAQQSIGAVLPLLS